ncbi:GDP-mannose 4,6-dehydratase [Microvirga calopogonii]|uniref:GDP-mannose 4,6-dehydratase n=1 Tax=Microvirga calopogonii TaxID=2078013 RepID=UPI001FDF1CC0|nr:GDP-mannose 4,6-dehydratase [Microvirga calopogonii]
MVAGKRVLVTGAAGFIGSHLVETLVQRDATVTAMVRYNSSSSIGNLGFLPDPIRAKLTVISGNIEDSDFVYRAIEGHDIVLHLAALIAIPYSYVAPRSYLRTNVEGTLNVLEAARRLGTGRVVHTSTSEVYGTALRTPIDEEHPLQGQSPYSASKIGADKIAESYFRSFETPVVVLRPFNTFGPRQSGRAFIPTIISQALDRDAIHLGSLTPQRDMTFVSDTVDGFIRAATIAGIEGETINLGTGETYSIGDFASRILRLMGMEKPIVHDASRDRPNKSEVMKLVSDNSKAARLLGWRPSTTLDDGLRQAIEFISANRHLYAPNSYTV